MSLSPFDHPLLGELLGDEEIARHLSAEAELEQMLVFESALAAAEGEAGVIPRDAADGIARRLATFRPDVDAIRHATARDGVDGVEYVRQLRQWIGAPHDQYVHFGATSQDLVDTALVLRLRPIMRVLTTRLGVVAQRLTDIDHAFGKHRLMGRTRMQDALPITVSDRIASWRAPLLRHIERAGELMPRLMMLQFGGAVGTLDKLGDRGPAIAAALARRLDLGAPDRAWHTQRDGLAELAGWLSLVTGSLGKAGADIVLMAQGNEIVLDRGGGSSAMPHKSNPVGGEVLVTLARFNATLVAGMHNALVHEQERSGAAWTLEWMLLPQMLMTAAASLRTAIVLMGNLSTFGGKP